MQGFCRGCAGRSPSHPSRTAILSCGKFSGDQALTTGSLFRSTRYLRRRPCFWDSALPATDFTRGDERPLRKSLLALVATRRLVVFLWAIELSYFLIT
jgi:hypothetical protein